MKTDIELIGLMRPEVIDRATRLTWSRKSRFLAVVRGVWESFLTELMGRAELKIRQTCDRSGVVTWHIYDPATNQSTHCASEQEVRIWLDRRYYLS